MSVAGSGGSTDLVVPWAADCATVAAAYAEAHGLTTLPSLALTSGRVLDHDERLDEAGVDTGTLLVVLGEGTAASSPRADLVPPGATDRRSASLALLAALSALLAAVVAGVGADGSVRYAAAAVLAVGALAALVTATRILTPPVAPAFAAAAVFTVSLGGSPGATLVSIAAAAIAGAVTAVVGRSLGADRPEHERVWLWVSLLVALGAAVLLLLGAGAADLAPVLFGVALVVARVVPSLAIDVPDQVLLDLDKLAVTAWSARERPRGRRGRAMVPADAVADLLRTGHRTVYATALALSLVVVACVPVMVLAFEGLQHNGSLGLLACGGVALVLMARAHRAVVPRRAMRVAGSVALGSAGLSLVLGAPSTWLLPFAVAAIGGGALIVVSAVAVGSGWRSVWWARVGEVLEGLTLAAALGLLPLATGLFDAVRGMTS